MNRVTVALPDSRRPPLEDPGGGGADRAARAGRRVHQGRRARERERAEQEQEQVQTSGQALTSGRVRAVKLGRVPGRALQYARSRGPVTPALATVLALCAPVQTGDVTDPGRVTPADAASLALVVWCLVRLLRGCGGRLTPGAAAVLGAPAVAFAVTTAASADPAASLPGYVRYLQVFVLVPGAVLLLLRDGRDFRALARALVLLALVQGAVGTVQSATGTGASYMGEDVRAVGTFGPLDVMGMATVVSFGLVAALALGLTGAGAVRFAALGCAAALTVPLVLSYSRGAWIATAVACTAVLFLTGARRAVPVLLALGAAGVVLTVGTGAGGGTGAGAGSAAVAERLTSIVDAGETPDRSVSDRYDLWSAAAGIWRENPVTGVGPKNFAAHRDGHAPLGLSSGSDTSGAGRGYTKEPLLSPHNMYLLVLSEQGLVGFAAFAWYWAALLGCVLRRLRAGGGAPGAVTGSRWCGVTAAGLLVWQAADFLYADIGGPSTVLTGIVLGLACWWAFAPAACSGSSAGPVRSEGAAGPVGPVRSVEATGPVRPVGSVGAPAR